MKEILDALKTGFIATVVVTTAAVVCGLVWVFVHPFVGAFLVVLCFAVVIAYVT